jgi:hypothetical protein
MPISWNSGYYIPKFEKNLGMRLFGEFGTDWLTNVVCGGDPYSDNRYLPAVRSAINVDPNAPENIFLTAMLSSLRNGSLGMSEVTHLFAKGLLSEDLDYLNGSYVETPEGKTIGFREMVGKLEDFDLEKLLTKLEMPNSVSKFFIRPIFSLVGSFVQIRQSLNTTEGQTAFPGVLNICGMGGIHNPEHVLAHEYIHLLSFHEKSCHAGVPINGYRLSLGVTVKSKKTG